MAQAGSTFTDWQQVERDSLLFVDADFGWSEPPQRRRRRITESEPSAEYRSSYGEPRFDDSPPAAQPDTAWDQPTEAHSHFDEMMRDWNAAQVDGLPSESEARVDARAFDLSHPGHQTEPPRRTVLITGRGDARYLPAPRQRRGSELRFHERSGFSPDR